MEMHRPRGLDYIGFQLFIYFFSLTMIGYKYGKLIWTF